MSVQAPHPQQPEYTVTQLSTALKRVVEGSFENVRLRGEISGFKRHSSGHLYFSLKDSESVINAICWRGVAGRLNVTPADGLEVIVTGKVTTYPARSQYQIMIESMDMAGEGAILKMLEERKRKLAAEGLFDPAKKKPLPFLPRVIGVITSPTGAVIHDIQTTIERRFPRPILLCPVNVQGVGAAESITRAIQGFSLMPAENRPDVLIIARGGGSLEDLLPFSEESVVRAVAACPIPTISSVGHETDTMLIDYAADKRASTPTAASEMAVPVRRELLEDVDVLSNRLWRCTERTMVEYSNKVSGLSRGLVHPGTYLMNQAQRTDDLWLRAQGVFINALSRREMDLSHLANRMKSRLPVLLDAKESRLALATRMLESTSYHKTLERGFVLVWDKQDGPITRALKAREEKELNLTFTDGEVKVRV